MQKLNAMFRILLLFVFQTRDAEAASELGPGTAGGCEVGACPLYSAHLRLSLLLALERRKKLWQGKG